jgi:hypothetical protein
MPDVEKSQLTAVSVDDPDDPHVPAEAFAQSLRDSGRGFQVRLGHREYSIHSMFDDQSLLIDSPIARQFCQRIVDLVHLSTGSRCESQLTLRLQPIIQR